jgi:two-component system NtrC family sensor kinase
MLLIKTSQDAIKASVLRGHQEIAIRAASEVGLFIQQPKELLISTASILGVVSADAWSQETVLVELALNNPIFSRIVSINKNGMEIATSELGSELKDRTDELGFIKAVAGEFYISDVYIQDNHTPYVKLAVPIRRLGEVIGVLFAKVNLRGIWDIVDRIKLNKTGMAYVVSDKGILIAHPDKKKVLANENMLSNPSIALKIGSERSRTTNRIVKSVLNGQIGSIEYLDDDKQKQVSSFAPILGLGWGVVVTQSADEAFSFSWAMKAQSWILIILSELVVVVISFLIARALVKPIKALAEATKQVAQGKLDEYIPSKRKDELGELVRSFNNMINKLKEAKASERLSIIGKAATAIVHELKNSLVMVNTLIGLFPKKHKDKRFVERFTKTVPQELERWKSMLQDLSDFSRGAKIELSLAQIDIAELIKDIHCLIEERTLQSNIKLQINIEEELPYIQGNSQKLRQVFVNLVTNAVDAMPNGGSLILSAAMANKADKRESKHHIEIKVRDTGMGLSTHSFEKIFEPFHTTKINGMGLGLAISRNIIQQHGGDIEVKSESNQGTSFIVKLPVSQEL